MRNKGRNKRGSRFTLELTNKQAVFYIVAVLVLFVAFYVGVSNHDTVLAMVRDYREVETIHIPEDFWEEEEITVDTPITIAGIDLDKEIDKLYDEGFRYYEIPEEYVENGGEFPEVVQAYLWRLCRERGLDYYTVVALIERESGYRKDAVGDSENSYGYGQVYKIWHLERMNEEEALDLTNPYCNLRVCTSYLEEITEEYGESGTHCVLMVYNMGEQGAKKLWKDGIYSTEYSRVIMERAQEIKQELKDK